MTKANRNQTLTKQNKKKKQILKQQECAKVKSFEVTFET